MNNKDGWWPIIILGIAFFVLSYLYYLNPRTVNAFVVEKNISYSSAGGGLLIYTITHYLVKDSNGNIYETTSELYDGIKSCNAYVFGLSAENEHSIIKIISAPTTPANKACSGLAP